MKLIGNLIRIALSTAWMVVFNAFFAGLTSLCIAAVTAFVTWMAGAASPRTIAIDIGAVCGLAAWAILVIGDLAIWVSRTAEAYRKVKLARALEELERSP